MKKLAKLFLLFVVGTLCTSCSMGAAASGYVDIKNSTYESDGLY